MENITNAKEYLLKFGHSSGKNLNYDIFVNFEEDFKKICQTVIDSSNQKEILAQENNKLFEQFEKLGKKMEEQRKLISNHTVLKLNQHDNDTPNNKNIEHSNKNSMTHAFKRGIDAFSSNFLTNEIKYLKEFEATMQTEIDNLQYQNTELQDQLKVLQGNSLIKQYNDIATQVDFSLIENSNHQNCKTPAMLRIIYELKPNHGGIIQSEEWVLSIINIIYGEKLICDLYDDLEKRPRKSLALFTKEWFCCKFGLQKISQLFLRDFIFSLKTFCCNNLRFKLFLMLLGCKEGYETKFELLNSNLNLNLGQNTNKKFENIKEVTVREELKRAFLSSQYGISILLQIIYLIKIKEHNSGEGNLETLLPGIDGMHDYQYFKLIIKEIVKHEDIPQTVCKNILEEFDLLLETDLYYRLLDRSEKNQGIISHEQDEYAGKIRFDFFCQFMLNKLTYYFIQEIENIHNSIKLNSQFVNESDLSYDLYRNSIEVSNLKRSDRWIDQTYDILMTWDVKKAPFYKTLSLMIPLYEECAIWENTTDNIYKDKVNYANLNELNHHQNWCYNIFSNRQKNQLNASQVTEKFKILYNTPAAYKTLKETFAVLKSQENLGFIKANVNVYMKDLDKEINNIGQIILDLKNHPTRNWLDDKEKIIKIIDKTWKKLRIILKSKLQAK